jgi:uncharacterized membrane protein YqaE (UPF0057 family)
MYCRFCGKEVKEKSIVCTGCGRPVDEPGSVTATPTLGWNWGLLFSLIFASLFFPPLGIYLGLKGLFSEATKVKASVLLTVAVFSSLIWLLIILQV